MKNIFSDNRVLKELRINDYRDVIEVSQQIITVLLARRTKNKRNYKHGSIAMDFSIEAVRHYRKTIDTILLENSNSRKEIFTLCQSLICSLQNELEKDSINAEERDRIEKRMFQILKVVEKNNRSYKRESFIIGLFLGGLCDSVSGTMAAFMMSNTIQSFVQTPIMEKGIRITEAGKQDRQMKAA